jgi:hypothetical protein
MGSMQCKVEFGYQLSICSGTKENLDRVGRSQELQDAYWLLASSPALNPQALTLVPICAINFFFCFVFFNKLFFYKYCYVHMIWISTKPCTTHVEGIKAYINKYAYKYTYICDSLIIVKFWESIVVWKKSDFYEVCCISNNKDYQSIYKYIYI